MARSAPRLRAVALFLGLATLFASCSPVYGNAVNGDFVPQPELDNQLAPDALTPQVLDTAAASEFWSQLDPAESVAMPPAPSTPDNIGGTRLSDVPLGITVPPSTGEVTPEAGVGLGDVAVAQDFARTGISALTNGRLYLQYGETAYVCSGTVVNSTSGDIVITAAHCLHNPSFGELQSAIFVPGDADNRAVTPAGEWQASSWLVPTQFDTATHGPRGSVTGDGWAYDFGFLRMAPNDAGQRIQEVTGAQGISFGAPTPNLTVVGYPSERPFDGRREMYCSSSSFSRSQFDGYSIACNMTPGFSGGAWITRFDPSAGAGYVVAATSTTSGSSASAVPLGQVAYELFSAMQEGN